MKRTIRLTESDIRRMVAESVRESLDTMGAEQYSDELNEGLLGMAAGAILDNVLIQKVVDMLANLLRLNRNGVLYRVLSSKLFAMALGNEIQNTIKYRRQQRKNGNGGDDMQMALQGAKNGDNGSLKALLGIGGGFAAGMLGGRMLGNMLGSMNGGMNGGMAPNAAIGNGGNGMASLGGQRGAYASLPPTRSANDYSAMQYTPYEEIR